MIKSPFSNISVWQHWEDSEFRKSSFLVHFHSKVHTFLARHHLRGPIQETYLNHMDRNDCVFIDPKLHQCYLKINLIPIITSLNYLKCKLNNKMKVYVDDSQEFEKLSSYIYIVDGMNCLTIKK